MFLKRWRTLERQRPQLRWVKWGEGLGAFLILWNLLTGGNVIFGVVLMVGFGFWGFSVLNRS